MNDPQPDGSDKNRQAATDSSNSVLVEVQGFEDTTIRPCPANIPRTWTRPKLPPTSPGHAPSPPT